MRGRFADESGSIDFDGSQVKGEPFISELPANMYLLLLIKIWLSEINMKQIDMKKVVKLQLLHWSLFYYR